MWRACLAWLRLLPASPAGMVRRARALALLAVLAAAVCAEPPPEVRCYLRPYINCPMEANGDGG